MWRTTTATHCMTGLVWTRADRSTVINQEYWDELVWMVFRVGKPVIFELVNGKQGKLANRAHALGQESAKQPSGRPLSHSSVRRKHGGRSVDPGSVPVEGQDIKIYIVEVRWMRRQKAWRYKYEVADLQSPSGAARTSSSPRQRCATGTPMWSVSAKEPSMDRGGPRGSRTPRPGALKEERDR